MPRARALDHDARARRAEGNRNSKGAFERVSLRASRWAPIRLFVACARRKIGGDSQRGRGFHRHCRPPKARSCLASSGCAPRHWAPGRPFPRVERVVGQLLEQHMTKFDGRRACLRLSSDALKYSDARLMLKCSQASSCAVIAHLAFRGRAQRNSLACRLEGAYCLDRSMPPGYRSLWDRPSRQRRAVSCPVAGLDRRRRGRSTNPAKAVANQRSQFRLSTPQGVDIQKNA